MIRKLLRRYRALKKEVRGLREELHELKANLARAALGGSDALGFAGTAAPVPWWGIAPPAGAVPFPPLAPGTAVPPYIWTPAVGDMQLDPNVIISYGADTRE